MYEICIFLEVSEPQKDERNSIIICFLQNLQVHSEHDESRSLFDFNKILTGSRSNSDKIPLDFLPAGSTSMVHHALPQGEESSFFTECVDIICFHKKIKIKLQPRFKIWKPFRKDNYLYPCSSAQHLEGM